MERMGSQEDLEKKKEEEIQRLLEEGRVLRNSSGANLTEGTLSVNNIKMGDGCRQNCIHCGAYNKEGDKWDLVANAVTYERIKEVLLQEFLVEVPQGEENVEGVTKYVKKRLIDLFANYVTTDINQEPLDSDAFLHFAKLVKKLSGGASRAVCVSHGVTMKGEKSSSEQIKRLREIVEFMGEYDVFVLSMDFARLGGKIDYKTNLDSYVTTLNELKPAIEKGVHVTVSIQGDDEKDGPYNRARAVSLYENVKKKLEQDFGWDPRLFNNIVVKTERAWVKKGGARLLPGVDPGGQCPVIPDEEFVYNHLKSATMGGFLDMITGGLYMHPYNAHRTYNDVSEISRKLNGRAKRPSKCSWEEVEYGCKLEDLSYSFTREGKRRLLRVRRQWGRLRQPELKKENKNKQSEEAAEAALDAEAAVVAEAVLDAEAAVADEYTEGEESISEREGEEMMAAAEEVIPTPEEIAEYYGREMGRLLGEGTTVNIEEDDKKYAQSIFDSILKRAGREEEFSSNDMMGVCFALRRVSFEDAEVRKQAERFLEAMLEGSKKRGQENDFVILRFCDNELKKMRNKEKDASVLETIESLLKLIGNGSGKYSVEGDDFLGMSSSGSRDSSGVLELLRELKNLDREDRGKGGGDGEE